ncbi:hypothetical protein C8R46DRAFT_240798 [Mycena filopes]|nr:hypothetical protein C8R46DRAFT_240798 [Mycena filopes]
MSTWLTQANYIFRELQIDSPFTDFVVIYHINFVVSLTEPPPETQGFLFLCPPDHFQVGPSSVRIPDFPWYWSLDPLGRERLTAVDAAARELPEVRLNARAFGRSWDERVYTGIRKFHKSKGFDPDTQDAARSLGQPLYRLSNDVDPLFAHVNELREEDDSVAGDSGSEEDESLPDDNDSDSDHSPTVEPHSTDDEVEISWSFRIIMNIQFALLLFLALSWLTGGM